MLRIAVGVEAGVAVGVAQRLDHRAEAGLRGAARTWRPSPRRRRRRRPRPRRAPSRPTMPDGVVGVEVDRQAGLLAQRRRPASRAAAGFSSPAMSLMPRMWAPARFQLLGEADIVFEVVLGAVGIEDVAGVADGAFAELARLAHRVHRDAHVLDPVEAVEDAEEVDAGLRRLADEEAAPRCRDSWCSRRRWSRAAASAAGCSAPRSRSRRSRSHGILGEEAHGDVEGGAAPAFEREELRQRRAHRPRRRATMS